MFRKRLAVLLLLTATGASASAIPEYPFIHTSGTSFLHVLPDRGEIDFEIVVDETDPAGARGVLEERITQLRALWTALELADSKIDIRQVRREILKDGRTGSNGEPMYRLICSAHLDIKDLSKWREVLQPLLDMPNLDNFSVSFSAIDREKIEGDLVAEAIKEARRKGLLMARAAGKRLLGPTAISSGPLKNLSVTVGLQSANRLTEEDAAVRNRQETTDLLSIPPLRMSQTADVIFKIK